MSLEQINCKGTTNGSHAARGSYDEVDYIAKGKIPPSEVNSDDSNTLRISSLQLVMTPMPSSVPSAPLSL